MTKVRIRNDDVLVSSRDWKDREFERFSRVHKWIAEVPDHFIHVPTILTTEIQQFPECIEFIKNEARAKRMLPELHGFHHEIDYQHRSIEDITSDLDQAVNWMIKHLDVRPKIWYTPRCAGQYPHPKATNISQEKRDQLTAQADRMRAAAETLQLEVVSEYDNKLSGDNGVCRHLMDGRSIDALSNSRKIEGGHKEWSVHWWERGVRLKRCIEAVKWGSWEDAKKQEPELFRG